MCGSGQSTFQLSDHFRRTTGVDISAAQISCAVEKAREKGKENVVDFIVSPADSLPFEDKSVDLITCAQAWHWFGPEVFGEIDRILKNPGALAVYGYSRGIMRHEECESILSHYYSHTLTWHSNSTWHSNNLYRDMELPYPIAERHDMKDLKTLSLSELKGYLTTWSAYQDYIVKHPGNYCFRHLIEKMKELLQHEDQGTSSVHLDTPYFLMLCFKT